MLKTTLNHKARMKFLNISRNLTFEINRWLLQHSRRTRNGQGVEFTTCGCIRRQILAEINTFRSRWLTRGIAHRDSRNCVSVITELWRIGEKGGEGGKGTVKCARTTRVLRGAPRVWQTRHVYRHPYTKLNSHSHISSSRRTGRYI